MTAMLNPKAKLTTIVGTPGQETLMQSEEHGSAHGSRGSLYRASSLRR